ncbi:hypothetical protein M885DRAFT_521241 [Pelagophyceae sp. CCMP2097]|nr:hypothetical protein M885DRAFT_521241 [Pelagophyceae sp. CCMP2097]
MLLSLGRRIVLCLRASAASATDERTNSRDCIERIEACSSETFLRTRRVHLNASRRVVSSCIPTMMTHRSMPKGSSIDSQGSGSWRLLRSLPRFVGTHRSEKLGLSKSPGALSFQRKSAWRHTPKARATARRSASFRPS